MSVYLDHAATTPMRPEAMEAWVETARVLQQTPGNPAALHSGGRAARRMLEDARERLADAVKAEKNEVLFTSGATESNALGVMGVARARLRENKKRIVTSSIEHDAVGKQAAIAKSEGFVWDVLPVDKDGVTDVASLQVGADIAVVSLSHVCSETGVIQPLEELVQKLQDVAPVHTDAAQSLGHIPVDFAGSGLSLMTISGHKIGAPVGTGALMVKRGIDLVSDRLGGGQERQLRSGTVDAAGAVALAVAAEMAVQDQEEADRKYRDLRSRLVQNLPPQVTLTTDAPSSPSIVHLSLETSHPEVLLLALDQVGVMVSAGSACHAGVTRPSQILLDMGRSEAEALGVLRVSFGPQSTAEDVDLLLQYLPVALAQAQKLDGRSF